MKNVKKLLSTILAVVLLLSLVACGAKETPPAESETTKTEQNEATTTVPEDETFEFVMGTAVADTTSAYLAGVEFVNMVAENTSRHNCEIQGAIHNLLDKLRIFA